MKSKEDKDLFLGLKMSRWYLWIQVMILMSFLKFFVEWRAWNATYPF